LLRFNKLLIKKEKRCPFWTIDSAHYFSHR
jgi:hypothetical protein